MVTWILKQQGMTILLTLNIFIDNLIRDTQAYGLAGRPLPQPFGFAYVIIRGMKELRIFKK